MTSIYTQLQYVDTTEEEWNSISIPLSTNMLAYAKDTKVFKLGNGVDCFADLPVVYRLTNSEDIANIKTKFSELSSVSADNLVVVSPDGNGFTYVNVDMTQTGDKMNFNTQIENKAKVDHDHNNNYIYREQLEDITSITKQLNFESQDIVSQLILKDMEETERESLHMPNSFADEFNDTVSVDTNITTMEYTGDSYNSQDVNDNLLISNTLTSDTNVSSVRISLRGQINGIPNVDHCTELSRDNGNTWAVATMEKSAICTSNLDTVVGQCNFDNEYHECHLAEIGMDVEDVKGDCTTFVIDTENLRGHFTTPINSRICEGCRICLTNDIDLNILSINESGTSINDILIDNNISVGTYTVEKIIGIVSEDVSVNFDGRIELKTPIPNNRFGHTATLYQDKIYVIGGYNGSELNTTYIYTITSNTWSQGTNVPIGMHNHAATLYQDKIYVIGGWSGYELNTTYIYDITNNTWSTGRDIPITLSQHTATLYQDKIYVIGGYNGKTLNTMYIYDIASDTWSQGINVPTIVRMHTATLYQDKIYVIGGFANTLDNITNYNTVYIYNITNNTWSQGTNVVKGIRNHTATLYQDKIYVIGGQTSTTYFNTTYIYDIPNNTWSRSMNVPTPISRHATILYHNHIYNVGGRTTNEVCLKTVYTYSLGYDISDIHVNTPKKTIVEGEMGEIEYKANIPIAVRSHTTTLYQDKIYVIGGYNGKTLNTMYIYDIASDTWSQGANVPKIIFLHTATLYQDKIYVIGGYDGTTYFNTTYIYDITNNTWSTGANVPIAISQHTATLYQDKIYVIGGYNGSELNTTYIYTITSNTWSQGTNVPKAMHAHAATLYQDKIYVIGGWSGYELNTTYIYDITNNTWSMGTNIPKAMLNLHATIYQNKIYILGGSTYQVCNYNTVYIYDIINDTWSQGINVPEYIWTKSVLYKDTIYNIGGRSLVNGAYQCSNRVFTYSLQSNITYTPELNKYQTVTFPISDFKKIYSIIPNVIQGNNNIYYTIKLTDNENVYYTYQNNEWKPIVRLTDTIWEYRNGSIWHPAILNNSKTAISQAVSISTNQMDTSTILDIANKYKESIVSEISISAKCDDISYVPNISNLTVCGTKQLLAPEGKDLKWRFTSKDVDTNIRGIRLIWG
jgi:N-acetylneuraminic acid mutarotase